MSQQLESSRKQSTPDEGEAKLPKLADKTPPTSSPIIGSSVTRRQLYPNDPDGVPIGLTPLQKAVTDIAIVCKSIRAVGREYDDMR